MKTWYPVKKAKQTAQDLEFLFPCCVDVIWERAQTCPELSHWGKCYHRSRPCPRPWMRKHLITTSTVTVWGGVCWDAADRAPATLGVACISVGIWTRPTSPDGAPRVCTHAYCKDCSSHRPALVCKCTVKSYRQVKGVGAELWQAAPEPSCYFGMHSERKGKEELGVVAITPVILALGKREGQEFKDRATEKMGRHWGV